jgi:hypothetical protein
MIWNPDAIDYSSECQIQPDGTMKWSKIGCWVYTIEECNEIMKRREREGEFD